MTTSLDLGLMSAAKPRRNWRRGISLAILTLIALSAGFAGVRRLGRVLPSRGPSLSRAELPSALTAAPMPVPSNGAHSPFALLARDAREGVVNVQTTHTERAEPVSLFSFPSGPFGQFGGPSGQGNEAGQPFSVPELGTGFVISKDGLIVTNNHVIEGADKIEVVFADGTRARAKVVGADPKTDVALIRPDGARDYSPLPLGDSSDLLPGDWVVAIGSPYGLDHTVTAGIVSAVGRDIGAGPYDDFIQTDAAINPGNSGGPLLSLDGKVVGINTAINPQANTIGFAVPIDMAKEILPQLEHDGRVVRGWLGVTVQPITPELAETMKLDTEKGALVSQVDPAGPAAKAGIAQGDLIVRFGDREIEHLRELPRSVALAKPGENVVIELLRDGKRESKRVTVAELVDEKAAPAELAQQDDGKGSTAFGFDVADVPAPMRDAQSLPPHAGALITNVYPTGSAEERGLQRGDVILEVDKREVAGGLAAEKQLRESGSRALLLVRRDRGNSYAVVERRQAQDGATN